MSRLKKYNIATQSLIEQQRETIDLWRAAVTELESRCSMLIIKAGRIEFASLIETMNMIRSAAKEVEMIAIRVPWNKKDAQIFINRVQIIQWRLESFND